MKRWENEFPYFPLTVNKQYVKTRNGIFLHPQVRKFRQDFGFFCRAQFRELISMPQKPILRVMLSFMSPRWVTQKKTIRKQDVDNLAKAVLDGMVDAGIPDENIFDLTVTKLWTKSEKIRVTIFDLGPTLPYHDM